MTKDALMRKNRKLEQECMFYRRSNEYYTSHAQRLREDITEKDAKIEKLKEGIKWRDDGIEELEDEIDKFGIPTGPVVPPGIFAPPPKSGRD